MSNWYSSSKNEVEHVPPPPQIDSGTFPMIILYENPPGVLHERHVIISIISGSVRIEQFWFHSKILIGIMKQLMNVYSQKRKKTQVQIKHHIENHIYSPTGPPLKLVDWEKHYQLFHVDN